MKVNVNVKVKIQVKVKVIEVVVVVVVVAVVAVAVVVVGNVRPGCLTFSCFLWVRRWFGGAVWELGSPPPYVCSV